MDKINSNREKVATSNIISKAVVLVWSLLAALVSKVSVTFHFMFVHYTFSSVWVSEWPPFGK